MLEQEQSLLETNTYTKTHYTKRFSCVNCGFGSGWSSADPKSGYVLSIPLGETQGDFIRDKICPRCKCKNVLR